LPGQACDRAGGELVERLAGRVQAEVEVGDNAEEVEDLLQHLLVLAGDDGDRLQHRVVVQGRYDGGHLDGFRAGPEHDEDAVGHGSLLSEGRQRAA